MIPARRIAACGISWPDIRRYGRQLCPLDGNWDELDKRSDVHPGAALSIALIRHLVEKHVLHENDAISTVAFFQPSVTRYAIQVFSVVSGNDVTDTIHVPVVMLEVVEGRWARLGHDGSPTVFDIEEQRAASIEDFAKDHATALWSHSVCLLPLFLRLCPMGHDHGDKHDQSEDAADEAER